MNRNQAREIFQDINYSFHNFDRGGDAEFVKYWLDKLQEGDYEKTKAKLNEYTKESKWPPTFADILVVPHKPVQNHDAEDNKLARQRVKEEMADPEKRAEREKMINEAIAKLRGVSADE